MLKAVVIGLGALIVIALGAVALGIVQKFSHPGPRAAAEGGATLVLPKGAVIVEMQSQPSRLILRLRSGAGEEVDIVDTSDGHVVARIR
jgi:hypothetical protein